MAKQPKRKVDLTQVKRAHKKGAFLRAFKKLGGRHLAANAVGVHPNTIWEWQQEDEAFRKEVLLVEELDTEAMEKEMRRRAMKKSDLLMMFAMKKRKPEYRDSSKLELSGNLSVSVVSYAKKKEGQ